MSSTDNPARRPRGRPKGSKNGPNAGPVGRPRKDGQAPKKHQRTTAESSLARSTTAASSNTRQIGDSESEENQPSTETETGRNAVNASSITENQPLTETETGCNTVNASPITVQSSTLHKSDDNTLCQVDIRESMQDSLEDMPSVPLEVTGLGSQALGDPDINGDVLQFPSNESLSISSNLMNAWSPPKGIGLRSEYEDFEGELDEDGNDADIFGETCTSSSEIFDEFIPLPDDDEAAANTVPAAESETTAKPRRASPREQSSMPTWLSNDYANTREQLVKEMGKNASRKPTCYDLGTFVVGSASPFFTTQKFQPTPFPFFKPQYFVWIPHLLTPNRIPCPNCASTSQKDAKGNPVCLAAHGWCKSPRRVVDLDKCIYIIGHRYFCNTCRKTYQSWSPALLAALPRTLSLQFTHHLSYRSGLTDQLVNWMRSCFLQGIGPMPFSKMVRTNHIRYYEKLHLQYLETVYAKQHSPFASLIMGKYNPFPAFDDRNGYAGFSPSAKYFRSFYVHYIASHSAEIDQYSAMLSARILQNDHSFKVPKHLGKLNGIPVFTALHTSINEYSEIRSMVLTPTKAHNQYMPALAAVSNSLSLYGHSPIEAVFTDNPRADKPELESRIPSLRESVVPVIIANSSLNELSLPPSSEVLMLSSAYQVNTRFNTLMEKICHGSTFYVALDMEWPVNRESGVHGSVALISMTYGQEIFLIPLIPYFRDGYIHLPHALLAFLRSPQIQKVGVRVSGDLTRLFNDCGYSLEHGDLPFTGALELGQLAKEKNAAPRASIGLADLSARVLRRYLPKDPSIRVSEGWSTLPLSPTHEKYAALDVYATWAVFKALIASSTGETLSSDAAGGTLVSLYSQDHALVVAYGYICPDRPQQYEGVNITKTRVLVTITHILVPGYVIPHELLRTRGSGAVSLSQLPSPPFNLVCKAKHLRTRLLDELALPLSEPSTLRSPSPRVAESAIEAPDEPANSAEGSSSQIPFSSDGKSSPKLWYADMDSSEDLEDEPESESELPSAPKTAAPSNDQFGEMRARALDRFTFEAPTTISNNESDQTSNETAVVRSRVLGDIWHLMHQFPISKKHGLRRPFARALRDAFFLIDIEDESNMKTFLESKGVTWEYMMRGHKEWLFKRVRRFVPPPEELLPRVRKVLQAYGPLRDSKTDKPLFNAEAWEIAENALENIQRGLFSDPPGLQVYYSQGKDKHGLWVYKCCRGTNAIEGGVHQNIIRWFGAFNAGPDFAVQILRDYRLYHNLKVGTLNRTGEPYRGSFDIWTRNKISCLLDALASKFTSLPHGFGPGGWVNGNYYIQSTEIFGILPMGEQQRQQLGMLAYNRKYAEEHKIRHEYLALQQMTQSAILPVHTKGERALFKVFIARKDGPFTRKRQPNWEVFAAQWAEHADGVTIFYKLPEHLKTYWNTWGENANERNSIKINQSTYDEMVALLLPSTSGSSVHAAQPVSVSHQITQGQQAANDGEVDTWHLSMLLGRHSIRQSAIQFAYGEAPPPLPGRPLLPKKRSITDVDDNNESAFHSLKRKPRTCMRCHRADCDGRFNRRPCHHPGMSASGSGSSGHTEGVRASTSHQ